jgi:hypothetical protein
MSLSSQTRAKKHCCHIPNLSNREIIYMEKIYRNNVESTAYNARTTGTAYNCESTAYNGKSTSYNDRIAYLPYACFLGMIE